MINQGNNVPDKTIAVFNNRSFNGTEVTEEKINSLITKPDNKPEWFTQHFYRCLPLTIANQYGFVIRAEHDFSLMWNGSPDNGSVKIFLDISEEEKSSSLLEIASHFGAGIITIMPSFTLRTPPGVNLMTINPPNYIMKDITVMSGVIETDHLRRNFTFNLKVQTPNVRIDFKKGQPLAGFLPIPRYFADEFKIVPAENIFDKDVLEEEVKAEYDAIIYRKSVEPRLKFGVGRLYYSGLDVYGNKFPDHQKP